MSQVELIAEIHESFEVNCNIIGQIEFGYGDFDTVDLFSFSLADVGGEFVLDSGVSFDYFSKIITRAENLEGEGAQFGEKIPLIIRFYDASGHDFLTRVLVDNPSFVNKEIASISLEFMSYTAWKNKTEICFQFKTEVSDGIPAPVITGVEIS